MPEVITLEAVQTCDIPAAAELAWTACATMENACYPLPCSEEAIRSDLRGGLLSQNVFQLLCSIEGRIVGLMRYFIEPGEKYLQTTLFVASERHAEVFAAFIRHLREHHAGYTALLGFPAENTRAAQALLHAGFTLCEASVDTRLEKAAFNPTAAPFHTEKINAASFSEYAAFHDASFQGVYWTAARVWDCFARWHVYAVRESGAVGGGIFLTATKDTAEVFGMALNGECRTPEHAKGLLSAAVSAVFAGDAAVRAVIFFVDAGDALCLNAALSVGFAKRCDYRCYSATLQ